MSTEDVLPNGQASCRMSTSSPLALSGLPLNEADYASFCETIVKEAISDKMFGDKSKDVRKRNRLMTWIRAIAREIRSQYQLCGVAEDTLKNAVSQVFHKKNEEIVEAERRTQQIQRDAEARDTIIMLRLDAPKPRDYTNALSFVPDTVKQRILLCNITGKYLDTEQWWQSIILEGKAYDPLTEEVACFSEQDSETAVLDSNPSEALQKKQTMTFVIQPKNGTCRREQLVEASQPQKIETTCDR